MTTAWSLLLRAAALAAVWWALLEGRTHLWPAAVPALAAAVAAGLLLAPPERAGRLRLRALPRFAVAFAVDSVRGGADVAARALAWKVRLDPALVEYRLTLPPGSARHLFAATVSLLPGTLSARLDDERLTVHVLDAGRPVEETLARLEARVAALFGAPGV